MLRLPPFDQIGATPTPDFVNADPGSGVRGSIINALIFNQLQHEGENLQLLAGLTPDGMNLFQWTQAVSRGGIWAGNLTGTGDLAIATLGGVLPAFLQGMRVGAVATATNTVTNPKLRVTNLGSTGAYTDYLILKEDGSALAIGEIKAGRRYRFEADGAGNVLITGGGMGLGSGLPTGTSTTKAPKLVGLTVNGSGQSITTSAPNTLSMSPLSGANNLSGNTSTWASNKLTVGAGEAGLWIIQGYVGWPLPVGGFFVSMYARKNGSAIVAPAVGSTMSGGVTGDAQAVTFCAVVPLSVGDQIDFYAYQQCGSTVATLSHNASMYLLSAV